MFVNVHGFQEGFKRGSRGARRGGLHRVYCSLVGGSADGRLQNAESRVQTYFVLSFPFFLLFLLLKSPFLLPRPAVVYLRYFSVLCTYLSSKVTNETVPLLLRLMLTYHLLAVDFFNISGS